MIEAVIFDLDGVLVETEELWNVVRERLANERGGRWHDKAPTDMMGMNSHEWSRYMHEVVELPMTPEEINDEVVARMSARYREDLPLIPGAVEAVRRMAEVWPLGLASSANRPLIELFLELTDLQDAFKTVHSSEEVGKGKPAPDVYLAAAESLGVHPRRCAAVEDSGNGIRSASAAGMRVIAYPNRHFPPDAEVLGCVHAVISSLDELTPDLVDGEA